MTARYAVVASTLHIAEQYIEAFGLDPAVWQHKEIHGCPPGAGWDRVVIIRPHWSYHDRNDFERGVQRWCAHTHPGAPFKLI